MSSVKEHGVKRGGLYGRFIKGEGVPGTIGVAVEGADVPKTKSIQREKEKRKNKSVGIDDKAARRAEKLGLDAETYAALPVRSAKVQKTLLEQLRGLEPEKRRQYAVRAEQKGQRLEVYYMNRVRKNEKAAKKAKG